MKAIVAQILILAVIILIILIFMVISFIYRFNRIDNKLKDIRRVEHD